MNTRDIRGQLPEFYGAEVSPDLAFAVTDRVIDGVAAKQVKRGKLWVGAQKN